MLASAAPVTPSSANTSDVAAVEAGHLLKSILGSFRGKLRPVKVELSYQLATFLVAVAMVLLPLIYLALIGATGWGVFRYATEGLVVFDSVQNKKGAFFVYATPLFVGIVAIVFLIKPLFARRPKPEPAYSLDAENEPVLFRFVERLCQEVGAPIPTRIDVDCQVNASASFRRGLLSLGGNDLVLTIGLPLVHGLSLDQLAGVLAHEFGHFAQGAGMRLSYLVRSINAWFARVVYDRDSWDEQLDGAGQEAKGHIMLYLAVQLARGMVWLSRRVLWVLMHVGHGLSCMLLRQMEFDADRYEARLVGAETFAETARRLNLLAMGQQGAMQHLSETWERRRLVDSLPELIVVSRQQLDPEIVEQLEEARLEARTSAFDTHPADADRVASAALETDTPVFQTDLPASSLFSDYQALARRVSRQHFETLLDQEISEQSLLSIEELLELKNSVVSDRETLNRFVVEAPLDFSRSWPWGLEMRGEETELSAVQKVERARLEFAGALESLKQTYQQWQYLRDRLIQLSVAEEILESGSSIEASNFDLERADAQTVAMVQSELSLKKDQVSMTLTDLERLLVRRFLVALNALDAADSESQDLAAARRERDQVLPLLRTMMERWDDVLKIQNEQGLFIFISTHLADAPKDREERLEDLAAGIRHSLERLVEAWDIPCLIEPVPEGVTLGAWIVDQPLESLDEEALVIFAEGAVARAFELCIGTITRLGVLAEKGEEALGFEPLKVSEEG